MKKCKCIKESIWFLIDDSFDEDSKINGGQFSFQVNNTYYYYEKDTYWGKSFLVIHEKHSEKNPTGFDERKFFEHFEII